MPRYAATTAGWGFLSATTCAASMAARGSRQMMARPARVATRLVRSHAARPPVACAWSNQRNASTSCMEPNTPRKSAWPRARRSPRDRRVATAPATKALVATLTSRDQHARVVASDASRRLGGRGAGRRASARRPASPPPRKDDAPDDTKRTDDDAETRAAALETAPNRRGARAHATTRPTGTHDMDGARASAPRSSWPTTRPVQARRHSSSRPRRIRTQLCAFSS